MAVFIVELKYKNTMLSLDLYLNLGCNIATRKELLYADHS